MIAFYVLLNLSFALEWEVCYISQFHIVISFFRLFLFFLFDNAFISMFFFELF
jgi:hypothetical protein